MEKKSVKLLIAIESPQGLLNAPAIAASSSRVAGLLFGAEDFGREIGLPAVREREARDLIYARSSIVFAAASAHVQAIDGVWVDLNDSEGLLGFGGQLIDRPIVERARRTIDTAKSLGYDPRDCLKSSQGDSIVIPGTPDHSPG